ncbi:MAG: FAD/NAD(P)-binding oxidoreductase [Pseudomonadota bacterium]
MSDPDVVVIGAGPSGLAAASVTGAAGLKTLVLDDQPAPGGQVWRAAEARRQRAFPPPRLAYEILEPARANATIANTCDVIDLAEGPSVTALHRRTGTVREYTPSAIIIATGAMERPLLIPGWTLPGVMSVGALQTAMKQSSLVPATPVALVGQGPLLLLVARELRKLGGAVGIVISLGERLPGRAALRHLPRAVLCDPGLMAQGAGLAAELAASGVAVVRNPDGLAIEGNRQAERIVVTKNGRSDAYPAQLIALHDGVIPNTQLTRLMNLDHTWRGEDEAFAPRIAADGTTEHEGIFVAGDAQGINGAALAVHSGRTVGAHVAQTLGRPAPSSTPARQKGARAFISALYPPTPVTRFAADDTVLCRCEGVTVGAARRAMKAGATGPNRVKTATRCGMGPCQSRLCGNALTRLLAHELGRPPDEIGALRIRPPLKPILLGDIAAPQLAASS